jgi:uncharacterized protein YcfL
MKQLFFITITAFLLVACSGGNKNNNATNVTTIAPHKKSQLNISILLDLSDRISPKINPDAQKNDIENIKTITEFFRANMKSLNAFNAKGKIRVFLVPPPSNSEINSIVSKLNIDCSRMDNKEKKEVYDTLTGLYTQNLNKIYKETIATSAWFGSDIWRFFKDDVKDYCVENDTIYRNILIILTDGYLYHEQSKFNAANRFTYLLNGNLAKYRKQNWKLLVAQNDFGIMTERDDLNDLEALVLEIKAENPSNKIDEDILPFVLKKWFDEMNVSRYEVYRSDLPANTKKRIEIFLNK